MPLFNHFTFHIQALCPKHIPATEQVSLQTMQYLCTLYEVGCRELASDIQGRKAATVLDPGKGENSRRACEWSCLRALIWHCHHRQSSKTIDASNKHTQGHSTQLTPTHGSLWYCLRHPRKKSRNSSQSRQGRKLSTGLRMVLPESPNLALSSPAERDHKTHALNSPTLSLLP